MGPKFFFELGLDGPGWARAQNFFQIPDQNCSDINQNLFVYSRLWVMLEVGGFIIIYRYHKSESFNYDMLKKLGAWYEELQIQNFVFQNLWLQWNPGNTQLHTPRQARNWKKNSSTFSKWTSATRLSLSSSARDCKNFLLD